MNKEQIHMSNTAKFRLFSKSGNLVDFIVSDETTPEQVEALVEGVDYFEEQALAKGFVIANQTQGATAVAKGTSGNEAFHAVRMDIYAQTDGRTKVEFFGDTHKQPVDDFLTCSSLWTADKLQELIAPYYEFRQETFQTSQSFKVDMTVEYAFSEKTNKAGNPYKNVKRILPAGGAPPERIEKPAPPVEEPVSQPDDIPF